MFKFLDKAIEIIGWFKIMLSTTILGFVLGYTIYNYWLVNIFGIILGVFISIAGFIVGIVWATKLYRSKGTIHFLSKIGIEDKG